MARHHRRERPAWFEERGPIFQRAMDQFVAQLAGRPGVSREKKGMHKRLAKEAKSLFNYHRPFYERANHTLDITGLGMEPAVQQLCDLISRVARERRGEWDATRVP